MDNQLKPCPFCGSEAQMIHGNGPFEGRVQVDCTNCRNATFWWEEAVAVRLWNARPAALPSDAAGAPRYEVSAGGKWNTVTEAQYDAWRGKKRVASAAPVAPAAPQGWKLVPIEPDKHMRAAAFNVLEIPAGYCGFETGTAARDSVYAAMIAAAPTPTVAADAAAPTQVGKNALVLTGAQLLEALDFIAPDRATDPEQLEATVAIEFGEGHGGKAMYVWCAEYPEEGSFVLDGKPASGELMPINAPALQPDERATNETMKDGERAACKPCSDERPCIACFTDNGPCERPSVESLIAQADCQIADGHISRARETLQRAIELEHVRAASPQSGEKCPACAGNDGDTPCAFPKGGQPGCLRDARLARAAAPQSGEKATFVPQTFAGFADIHVNETGHPPDEQQAFNAGVRAGIARAAAPQAALDEIVYAVQAYGNARADGGDSADAIGKVCNLLRALATAPTERMSDAVRDVLAERARHVSVEGWTPEHDDEHDSGEMADAAAAYALHASGWTESMPREVWPADWSQTWWKPTTPRRDLVKATALLIAEIERLDRAARKAEIEGDGK